MPMWSPKTGTCFSFAPELADGKSSGNGSEADRPVKWNIEEYPILSWKWRPRVFPRGADEQNGKDDSVLGVYVGFCPPEDVTVCERAVKGQLGLSDRISLSRLYLYKGSRITKVYLECSSYPKAWNSREAARPSRSSSMVLRPIAINGSKNALMWRWIIEDASVRKNYSTP